MAPASTTMTTATTHSAEWLAESQATVVTIFFALPIPLEICTTAFRLWVKANKTATRRLAFDDYLMILATVRTAMIEYPVCGEGE
jgi:hypothetical protein